jgi:hypothetical protein
MHLNKSYQSNKSQTIFLASFKQPLYTGTSSAVRNALQLISIRLRRATPFTLIIKDWSNAREPLEREEEDWLALIAIETTVLGSSRWLAHKY